MPADPMRKDSLHVPPATLLALAARAEAGGDDALSDDVWRALGWVMVANLWVNTLGPSTPGRRPDLSESIDAQAALPGIVVKSELRDVAHGRKPSVWHAIVECPDGSRFGTHAPDEPLARLAAKLRALAAQKESGGA